MEINLISPLGQTYRESNVSLSYSMNRLTDWAGYSIDRAKNVTLWNNANGNPLTWNITLTELSNGEHTLTVYANDTYGNMDVKTVAFAVGDIDLLSMSILPIIVAFVIIISVSFFILLYVMKQKSKSG